MLTAAACGLVPSRLRIPTSPTSLGGGGRGSWKSRSGSGPPSGSSAPSGVGAAPEVPKKGSFWCWKLTVTKAVPCVCSFAPHDDRWRYCQLVVCVRNWRPREVKSRSSWVAELGFDTQGCWLQALHVTRNPLELENLALSLSEVLAGV